MGSSQADTSNDTEEPLETDPTNRFQRCDEILGEGAYKNVYRAFDQEEGVEVAWNQLRIDHLSKKEAQKILSEIEILQSIRNEHIINFYASWSTKAPNGGERIVFVTELMSSGTLKQYLKKTLKGALKPKVLKSWCRQILQGLVYLHTHDPPIIHRDLKCDNIFINGNNGQLKIGDLGLAVVRHRTHVSSVLGTPEFMAPELYDERYDEKVDIYAFGMCVLEMVTKEYPYSECTNQAQIYRKVTQGIKPQSLEQVQDPETREFINRCLDHDDRTRPSAQELLDSDFLMLCASAPLMSASMGFFHHPTRSLTTDGMEFMDGPLSSSATTSSNRSSFADPFMPSISPTSTYSMPSLPSVLRTQPLQVKAHPQPITIPTTEFTTTTVDADNKTYHIRSNLLPQTPTFNDHEDTQEALNADVTTTQSEEPETPTLHSHANSKTCSIQVLQYGEAVGNHLNLKMICTCPVAGPRDVTVAAGTHEIKFPFDLDVDTVEEVVAEMVREQILSGDDREEATSRIQELVDGVVAHATAKETKESRVKDDHSRKNNHKNHRQLNVPPACDMDQYGTSPTESIYDHYSSVGSSASIGWHGTESPIESDQGYGTVHHPKSPQSPPAITETTFPPLNAQPPKNNFSLPAERYSDVVQHPVALPANHPLSPLLVGRDRAASVPTQRPLSAFYLDQKSVSPETKASTTTTRDKDEDVGYTSPYRHGVSSSSITSHRRSPSVDAAVMIASAPLIAPTPSLASLLATGAKSFEDMSLVGSYQGTSGTIPDVRRSPPRELSPMLTHAEVLHRSQQQKQPPISPDSGVSSATSSLSEPAPFAPSSLLLHGQERLPHSANPVHIEPQHSHRHTIAPPQAKGDSNVILMTNEAKKDIEQWSNKVQHPMDPHTGGYNGSNYSSCPELSDDEEILDHDLKILREKQRQELEVMRLQHVQQWEKMMKLKEQKGLRKSETNTSPPSSLSSAPTVS
ncbi:Serine/threonine-protein kinase wnk3 [Podila verticillata]|nr:Serine/threonine-protein kinase wnk3 [Podila verticillata]